MPKKRVRKFNDKIQFRCTKKDKKNAQIQAEFEGKELSQYCREIIFGSTKVVQKKIPSIPKRLKNRKEINEQEKQDRGYIAPTLLIRELKSKMKEHSDIREILTEKNNEGIRFLTNKELEEKMDFNKFKKYQEDLD